MIGTFLRYGFYIFSFQLLTSFIKPDAIDKRTVGTANLLIRFKAMNDGQPFVFKKNYTNHFGESYSIDRFRFYAGRFLAANAETPVWKAFSAKDYFLIDFSDSVSTAIALTVREGSYDRIRFQLGIDSIYQTSGAMDGALDPANGMFWTWNSGYISFKIEGTSPISNKAGHMIAYHIGGYKQPDAAIRNIEVILPAGHLFTIRKNETCYLDIPLNINDFFDGPTALHIASTPVCTTPGPLAEKLCENFSGIFKQPESPIH